MRVDEPMMKALTNLWPRDSHGRLHSTDKPTCTWSDGMIEWYAHGKLHRDDGPAVTRPNGHKHYYLYGYYVRIPTGCLFVGKIDVTLAIIVAVTVKLILMILIDPNEYGDDSAASTSGLVQAERDENGDYHCEDGPAVICFDGKEIWFIHGKKHREGGPALICPNGYKEWHINGKLHREDGPAVINDWGDKAWYLNGKQHREDGPAVIGPNVGEHYFLNDVEIDALEGSIDEV